MKIRFSKRTGGEILHALQQALAGEENNVSRWIPDISYGENLVKQDGWNITSDYARCFEATYRTKLAGGLWADSWPKGMTKIKVSPLHQDEQYEEITIWIGDIAPEEEGQILNNQNLPPIREVLTGIIRTFLAELKRSPQAA